MDYRFFLVVFMTVLSVFTSCRAEQVREDLFYIDLQKFPLYIKADFNPSDAVSPDLQDGSWHVMEQWSSALIRRLDLPGLPKRAFLSPWGRPAQEWTFVLPFTVDGDVPLSPGLYLAFLGDNWEIYLNGSLLKQEMHLIVTPPIKYGVNYQLIKEHHAERDVIVPLNSSFLHKGENIFTFRIVGDPTGYSTGFGYKAPYYIAAYDYIMQRHNEIGRIIIITILALLGIYHFLFFAIFREDHHNLICGFFFFGAGLYYLWRTYWIYKIIPNTDIVVRLEFFTVYFLVLFLMAYTDRLCHVRYSMVTKIYGVFCLVLAVSQLFFSQAYGSETLIVWQLVSIPAILWILIYNIVFPVIRELKNGKKFADILVNTYQGNLLIAVGSTSLTAIFDLIDSFALHYSLDLASYGMVVFALSVTLMLFRLSVIKNRELKEKSALLEKATNPAAMREKTFNSYGLTEREKEIARLMVEGLDNKDISERLYISERTIAFHVTNIFRKFGINDGKNKGRALFLTKLIN